MSVRRFIYGDPDGAFAAADARVSTDIAYPRNSFTPIECFVVVAEYDIADDSYDAIANFQGPFSIHPVMARALARPRHAAEARTPADSGGSFGTKLAVFPHIVLMCIASRIAGRPVKWVEDRLEHLQAASTGPARIATAEAAVTREGRILALRFDTIEDYGAFLRAPMPGPLYRMHGASTGAYDVAHLAVTNRVVLTNTMPAGLIRGFGGPQHYLALERLVQRIAAELNLDPLDVIRRNLVRATFPTAPPPARFTIRATTRARSRSRSATAGLRRCGSGKRRRARQAGPMASASPRWSSPGFPTWAISRPYSRPRRASAPVPRTARCRSRPSPSIPWAPSR